ncbi:MULTISPECIES: cysteine--tRNA ligase [Roseobacteraceae]|uniref:Cysteine--tRNA ligase n=1 Tax=Celeribacter baekdonensis B30 TaxID=1208323 RepID=K2IQQ7_9RHOB|nr:MULTISPECIES: cysteine--tRNA ligase [Roseobacteraceae]EKE72566.1 cysteinyl-tRNA synthetase [Celeribacter baekdonensis B30]KAB6714842.1 cysteine--tRNA ligase [Roseobacter sp. TSBP12]|tara:strand:+ start:2949 stop:4433 length:1485 start_codon:yes stop_codon:yes gene_type:complete
MTVIKLTNTKTRKKEVFTPIDADNVRMYVCGPTVYDRAHIGNARPVIVFDVLYRLLRHVYGADHVTYVRNFTDVDDKINARAEASGRSIREITDETTQWYLDDMRAVGALDPNEMPRATEYIPQMIAMIETLIAKGHAYSDGAGHVLFSVNSYEKYGALSGRSVDDMIAGARVEVADNKRDPMDFVLWKPSSDDQPGWDSPWGYGRPGWHIECSAMSYELLGESFDIHGGGNDLMFPHHENEIAQSCCAHGHDHDGGGFANYWLHNEMLQVEGKKMSKSLGNFFTVRDLLDGHDGMASVPGEVIRFVFLSTHYRKPMDWTAEKAEQAKKTLWKWRSFSNGVVASKPSPEIVKALADDLNTHDALSELHRLASNLDAFENGADMPPFDVDAAYSEFVASANLLGLLTPELGRWAEEAVDLSVFSMLLEAYRSRAKETKDFSEVDSLKSSLLAAGVEVRMTKDGVELDAGPNFDASKLEGVGIPPVFDTWKQGGLL